MEPQVVASLVEPKVTTHLSQIIRRMIEEPMSDPLEEIENLSLSLKSSVALKSRSRLAIDGKNEIEAWIKERKSELWKETTEEEESQEEKEEAHEAVAVPNVFTESRMWQWAGIDVSDDELLRLNQALCALCEEDAENIKECRLFGKVYGTENDLWIAECFIGETGSLRLNDYHYYALPASDICGKSWVKLPKLTEKALVASRGMVHLVTGDLSRPVKTAAHLGWTENMYLRALVARIACSSTIAPRGFFGVPEENEDESENAFLIERNEEFEWGDFANIESWVHSRPCIPAKNLHALMGEEDEEEDDASGEEKRENQKNAESSEREAESDEERDEESSRVALLSDISNDCLESMKGPSPSEEQTNAWQTRHWNAQPIGNFVLESLSWPGAVTLLDASNRQFRSVYFGNGLKFTSRFWMPKTPQPFGESFEAWDSPLRVQREVMAPAVEEREKEEKDDENEESDEDRN